MRGITLDIVDTDEIAGRRVPVGIVTDRDIFLEVLAQELDATSLSAGDIMSSDLITVRENEGVFQTIQLMRAKGARRAEELSQLAKTDCAGAEAGSRTGAVMVGKDPVTRQAERPSANPSLVRH